MGLLFPAELLISLEENCACRSDQLRQLAALYNDVYPPPRNLIVYGLQGTGKLLTVRSVLEARQNTHAVVKSRECLSLRHLLSKIYTACVTAVCQGEDDGAEEAYNSRSETVNALCVNLQRLLQGKGKDVVLVLEGLDKQRGLNPNTLPALARLSDIIHNFHLILIVTTPRALFLQTSGIPYLHFPPYTRAECISIIARSPPILAPQLQHDKSSDLPTLQKWYTLFATTVYDSLFSPTSLSLSHFRRTCETLWPRFIWPYINGEPPPGKGKNVQWDFPKLLVRQRLLFQTIGEETLAASLLPKSHATTFADLELARQKADGSINAGDMSITINRKVSSTLSTPNNRTASTSSQRDSSNALRAQTTVFLPFFPTLLLTAAYLASHTPPKLDILLFSRLSSSSRSARVKKSYHRRKLFQSPSKSRTSGGDDGGGSTPKRKSKSVSVVGGKSGLEMNLNLPRGFTLERVVAILRAVHPKGVPVSKGSKGVVDKVVMALAELERLRLVVPADGGGRTGENDGGGGVLHEERRWKVNVPRGFVEELGNMYQKEGLAGLLREFELVDAG